MTLVDGPCHCLRRSVYRSRHGKPCRRSRGLRLTHPFPLSLSLTSFQSSAKSLRWLREFFHSRPTTTIH